MILQKLTSNKNSKKFFLSIAAIFAIALIVVGRATFGGVGGAVASAIGERLARLSQGKQLLVVTHSPQVAARGDRHLLIAKANATSEQGTVTRTGVTPLDSAQRREEIARMLSGVEVTDEARAQAGKLLERTEA